VHWEGSEWRPHGAPVVSSAPAVPSQSSPTPLPLPDKPSIAVLPFQNMSGDPEQEYFADGMVEDIITALSRSKSPDTTATRPAKTPPDQTSIPNASPPATTTQTTGQTNQDPTVKEMNAKEKSKVERIGK
jgi:hypothetical protein